ncbi:uncharacterized protein LOC124441910 [Xenia sp. Carnegie-2017]|uniref:uncharacterized protein LOC124441910 n=1 Tax=Xenia sp. Carnegie-2017 TaxID=2897299 RepID=UPI001F044371|nr:uncharacterized protein LOC124441910 [Xenia sp. Carnegie-2017]
MTCPKPRMDPLTCLKRLFLLFIIPRIMATVVFASYDWRCMISMEKPVQNCTLDHVLGLGDAVSWITTWLSLSIVSSLILITVFICDDDFEFVKEQWKNIHKKGSFSLLFLMVLTLGFYNCLRSGKKVLMTLLFVLWVPTITVLIRCCKLCTSGFYKPIEEVEQGASEVNGGGGAGEAGEGMD